MLRKKKWVEHLLTKRDAIEHAVGMPLGRMLGCGHWGCVFESEPPWVVKLSIDPTEGPIWMKITALIREEQYGDGGFAEILSVRRIMPNLIVGGRNRKVWAIVREGIEPVFKEYRAKELGHHGGGTMIATSEHTNRMLGLHHPATPLELKRAYTDEDVGFALSGLDSYRFTGMAWDDDRLSREDAAHKAARIAETAFHGGAWAPLGESLAMLASNGVILRDVHLLNIGWHLARDDDDWDRVVIFDPGHTPTEGGGDIETVLVEEGREAL